MAKMTKDQLIDAIAEGTQVSKGVEVEAWQKGAGDQFAWRELAEAIRIDESQPYPPRDQVTDRKREVRFMDHVSRYSAFLEQGVDALSYITGQLLLADGSLNRGLS